MNFQHAWMYENAVEFEQEGHSAAASEQLRMLWQVAPDYDDTTGLAGKVGIFRFRLKGSYVGTMTGKSGTDQICFISVIQSSDHIKGDFAYHLTYDSSVFEGTINYKGEFVFTVAKTSGLSSMKFAGKVQSDGHLAGSWENLDDPEFHDPWEAR